MGCKVLFRGGFCLASVPGAEVEIGQAVLEFRRPGIGVDRVFILVDRVLDVLRTPAVDRLLFVEVGHGRMEIGGGAIGRLACVRARIRGRLRRARGGLSAGWCSGSRACGCQQQDRQTCVILHRHRWGFLALGRGGEGDSTRLPVKRLLRQPVEMAPVLTDDSTRVLVRPGVQSRHFAFQS